MSDEYPGLRIEGGLISAEVLADIREEKVPGQRAVDFSCGTDQKLLDLVSAAWGDAQERWLIFQRQIGRLSEGDAGTSITRAWVGDLLSYLGFDLVRLQHLIELDGRKYHISHRAGTDPNAPPVHIVGCRQSLDRRAESGPSVMAPHSMVQEFLNQSEELWGIVTNGMVLRLLRDSHLMKRQAYIEFDLEEIFTGECFPDFYLFFRLVHASRFPKGAADTESCLLEQYHRLSIQQGGRIRDGLRNGVEQALVILANGFLSHPGNAGFVRDVTAEQIQARDLYRQLLTVIYRLLFLMVCEERGLISSDPVYKQYYSITRLRRLIHHRGAYSRHTDLWTGLVVSFRLFSDEKSGDALGVPPLNGALFSEEGTVLLTDLVITNDALLNAMWNLAMYQEEIVQGKKKVPGPWRRVNYAALDVEELGSVYESLLDLHPVFLPVPSGGIGFAFSAGTERKSTGSYYTPPELVNELISSALVPVIEDRLRGKKNSAEKEEALLSLSVCDPACGSGHFLLAAARRIGRELARVRSGDQEPSPEATRHAIRDVITHCIYGVDKNPLAVDLCRVALWLEGHTGGRPLTFLDHRIRCGDSLVGVFDLRVLATGIPDDAYKPVTGDDKQVAKEIRARNKTERMHRSLSSFDHALDAISSIRIRMLSLPEDSPADIRAKAEAFRLYQHEGSIWCRDATACHLWTAAFFAVLHKEHAGSIPTTETIRAYLAGGGVTEAVRSARVSANRLQFFHWPLEFPEVFAKGGFDCVLGNPPWERVKLQQVEFFQSRDPAIANAPNRAAREKMIQDLARHNPSLWAEYESAVHDTEGVSLFLRSSGRFPLTGTGDVNTYAVFTELCRLLMNPLGRAGIIVPTGIATDATTAPFFSDLMVTHQITSLYDFENKNMFEAVDSRFKFCCLTLNGPKVRNDGADFAFFLHSTDELRNQSRHFRLTAHDIRVINPNTGNCPIFRNRMDAAITRAVYSRVPVLVDEGRDDGNPWGVSFLRMFDMAGDSHLFRTRSQLEEAGGIPDGNVFVLKGNRWLPLYEAKMFHQYDHRYGSYAGNDERGSTSLPRTTPAAHADPYYVVMPWYWVKEREVLQRVSGGQRWFLGWRDIARSTDERTGIFSVLPWGGYNHKIPLLFTITAKTHIPQILGNINSLAFDYITRQKLGGTSFGVFILKQLPVLLPSIYTPLLQSFILPRVVELTYTAWDLEPFAQDILTEIGPDTWNRYFPDNPLKQGRPHPFRWDEDRRAVLRADLDAVYARLYGLTKSELAYILTTFPVLKKNEEREYGEFRTERLVLKAWDLLEESDISDEIRRIQTSAKK